MGILKREVWYNVYKERRKTLWRKGDLRMMLVPSGRVGVAIVDLERMVDNKWVPLWSGRIKSEGNAVVVVNVTGVPVWKQ